MRALSGAIITAAALIGLGLTAHGIGERYSNFLIYKPGEVKKTSSSGEETVTPLKTEPDFEKSQVKISDLDGPMKLCLTVLVLAVLIGLGLTCIGLAYHHHRRYHEHLRAHAPGTASTHIHTGM